MSVEENKAVFNRLIEEVFNNGKLSVIPELIDPDFVVHVTPEYGGQEGLRQHVIQTRQMFPDVHITIDQMVAEGDMVGWYATLVGTHLPTGKRVSMPSIGISRIANGREIERWQMVDNSALNG